MSKIRLLDTKGDHLCDWTIRDKPLPMGMPPAAKAPFKWPNMVLWSGAHGEPDRFFALDPSTLPGQAMPALPPGEKHPELVPCYTECDEPLEIGWLY